MRPLGLASCPSAHELWAGGAAAAQDGAESAQRDSILVFPDLATEVRVRVRARASYTREGKDRAALCRFHQLTLTHATQAECAALVEASTAAAAAHRAACRAASVPVSGYVRLLTAAAFS